MPVHSPNAGFLFPDVLTGLTGYGDKSKKPHANIQKPPSSPVHLTTLKRHGKYLQLRGNPERVHLSRTKAIPSHSISETQQTQTNNEQVGRWRIVSTPAYSQTASVTSDPELTTAVTPLSMVDSAILTPVIIELTPVAFELGHTLHVT